MTDVAANKLREWPVVELCGNDDPTDVWETAKNVKLGDLQEFAKVKQLAEILAEQVPLLVMYYDGAKFVEAASVKDLPEGPIKIQAFKDVVIKSTSHSTGKFAVEKTDADWKKELTPEEFAILRLKGTDPAEKAEKKKPEAAKEDAKEDAEKPAEEPVKPVAKGFFKCRACGHPLYSKAAKFDSGCGWPAFDKCYKGAVVTNKDISHGMVRIEILCSNCGGHLGHVFQGEGHTDTDERHCVNNTSMKYDKGVPPTTEEAALMLK